MLTNLLTAVGIFASIFLIFLVSTRLALYRLGARLDNVPMALLCGLGCTAAWAVFLIVWCR